MDQNKKRLELRLDPESEQLLNTLLARTGLTKTSLIKLSLKVYASTLKKGHIMTIKYKAEVIDEKKSHKEDQEKSTIDLDDELRKLDEQFPYKY